MSDDITSADDHDDEAGLHDDHHGHDAGLGFLDGDLGGHEHEMAEPDDVDATDPHSLDPDGTDTDEGEAAHPRSDDVTDDRLTFVGGVDDSNQGTDDTRDDRGDGRDDEVPSVRLESWVNPVVFDMVHASMSSVVDAGGVAAFWGAPPDDDAEDGSVDVNALGGAEPEGD